MMTPVYRELNEPDLYAEREARNQAREQAAQNAERFMPHDPVEAMRTDIPLGKAIQLRTFASHLIDRKRYFQARADADGKWQDVLNDTAEIRGLAAEAAAALEPIIAKALAMAEELDPTKEPT